YPVRQELRITTIGCIDITKRGRKALRKRQDKRAKERRRRAAGVRLRAEYEANSIAAQARAEGVSRMTIYRRRRGEQNQSEHNVTGPSTALYSSTADRPVTLERKQAASEGEASPPTIMAVDRFEPLPIELRMMALCLPMDMGLARVA